MNLQRLLITALLLGFPGRLLADYAPLITTLGTGSSLYTPDGPTLGSRFTVGGNPLTVSALGLFDGGTLGFDQGHSVGLWTADRTLLARVDFSPGLDGFMVNGFRYQSLANAVVLQAGASYVLGANYPSGSTDGLYAFFFPEQETWSSSVNSIFGVFTRDGAGFTYPDFAVLNLSYVGPNALYDVPEPDTLELLLCSATAYLLWGSGRKLTLNRWRHRLRAINRFSDT